MAFHVDEYHGRRGAVECPTALSSNLYSIPRSLTHYLTHYLSVCLSVYIHLLTLVSNYLLCDNLIHSPGQLSVCLSAHLYLYSNSELSSLGEIVQDLCWQLSPFTLSLFAMCASIQYELTWQIAK